MKITIAYLYYNLLNLYGENGNIKILKKTLETQGINVMIKFIDINDNLEFEKYDLIYMGSGEYRNIRILINELKKYKKELDNYIEQGKFFLVTGNSLDMFGRDIIIDKKVIKALNIFDFYVKVEDINLIDRALFKSNLIDDEIIGYQKRKSLLFDNKYHLFKVIDGIGETINSNFEGINHKNFFATYLIGPFLIRNPLFLIAFLKRLILSKDKNFSFKDFNLNFEKQAYYNYLNYNYGIIKSE